MVKVTLSGGPSAPAAKASASVPLPSKAKAKGGGKAKAKVVKAASSTPVKNATVVQHLEKMLSMGKFPNTEEFARLRRALQRCTKHNVQRLHKLQDEVSELKAELRALRRPTKSKSELAKNDGKLAIRALKREHIHFKRIGTIADEYFKSLLEKRPVGKADWKLLRRKLTADPTNKMIVQKHTSLCASTHATKNGVSDIGVANRSNT